MPSEISDQRRGIKPLQPHAAAPEAEQLRCPRCESTNTKFCYYNNYNFSQPRHFCKSCRRYWTHGGTLRDVPVGGGSRKNAKRSRTISTSSSSAPAYSTAHTAFSSAAATAPPSFLFPIGSDHGGLSFTSLLNTQGPGLLALSGFGLGVGVGPGLEDMGYGLGRAVWPFPGISEGGGGPNVAGAPMFSGGAWQLSGGESGFVSGGDHCFGLPDLAISTHGNGMK